MTVLTIETGPSPLGRSSRLTAFLSLYTGTIFLSALLIFGVQPMFTKMVLPVLGGAPSVWSVAMVVFQALLLAGYAYAHGLVRALPLRAAAAIHLAVTAGAFLALPIQLSAGWGRPPADGETPWLVGLFLASVGLPFFALSANGPLLQAWFARSNHPHARDPYFLYGASNIGSFSALIAYPLVVEPLLPLREQSRWWTLGFAVLAGLIALCAFAAARMAAGESRTAGRTGAASVPLAPSPRTRRRDRLGWIALSFVPSGLLVSVTAHISTDIAAVPLLWVAPLALFLLTFVWTFRERGTPSQPVLACLQVLGTALVLFPGIAGASLGLGLALHLGLFFVDALICHGALYRRRPPAERLTEFYLCLSVGGMLGGLFCGLIAPRLFSTVLEHPILLVAAVACRPDLLGMPRAAWSGIRYRLAGTSLLLAAGLALAFSVLPVFWTVAGALILVGAMIVRWRTPWFVALAAVTLALGTAHLRGELSSGTSVRSFFGVHKIGMSGDGRWRTLGHGTTLHGAMRVLDADGTPAAGRPEPVTYYGRDGAIGQAVAAARARQGGTLGSATVIGLGAGSLACHAAPGEAWTFLEIDPEVARIAGDASRFRFLSACAPEARIVLGDARLTLADQPGTNALIVVDAFSSDSIPVHLTTREALGLYVSKLAPGGLLVVHISNRHLDLRRILARAAAEQGLVTFVRDDTGTVLPEDSFLTPSIVVAMARRESDLGTLPGSGRWTRVVPDAGRRPWSDDFSNVVEAMVDKMRR